MVGLTDASWNPTEPAEVDATDATLDRQLLSVWLTAGALPVVKVNTTSRKHLSPRSFSDSDLAPKALYEVGRILASDVVGRSTQINADEFQHVCLVDAVGSGSLLSFC